MLHLRFQDTAGEERFHSVAAQYYRGAHGVFLVYDVADRASFDALPGWAARLGVCREGAVKIVVGNKADMVRCLSESGMAAVVVFPVHSLMIVELYTCFGVLIWTKPYRDSRTTQESSRQVPTSEGQAFATSMGALFVEASAKDNVGVQQAFHDVVERILNTPGLCERTDRGPDVQESVDITQTPETAPQAQGGGCRC